jgi:hypothetical protein
MIGAAATRRSPSPRRYCGTLDGEAVVCGPDGVAVFDALHRRGTVTEVMLYAFDVLELDGEDLRGLRLVDRKKRLTRLLSGRRLGIALSDQTDDDLPAGLQARPRRHRVEAAEARPTGRAVAGLAQGQEPGQPGDDPGARGEVMMEAHPKALRLGAAKGGGISPTLKPTLPTSSAPSFAVDFRRIDEIMEQLSKPLGG